MKELIDHPDWKNILVHTLTYNNLQKNYKKDGYRGGKKLQMDFQVNPPVVKIMKVYYESFMGRADPEIPVGELEVEKRLLHEASHIWGYRENQSEEFANKFLALSNNVGLRASNDITIQDSFCV